MDESLRRIAYLKGLADGYEINGKSKEGKLLLEIIDTLEVSMISSSNLPSFDLPLIS